MRLEAWGDLLPIYLRLAAETDPSKGVVWTAEKPNPTTTIVKLNVDFQLGNMQYKANKEVTYRGEPPLIGKVTNDFKNRIEVTRTNSDGSEMTMEGQDRSSFISQYITSQDSLKKLKVELTSALRKQFVPSGTSSHIPSTMPFSEWQKKGMPTGRPEMVEKKHPDLKYEFKNSGIPHVVKLVYSFTSQKLEDPYRPEPHVRKDIMRQRDRHGELLPITLPKVVDIVVPETEVLVYDSQYLEDIEEIKKRSGDNKKFELGIPERVIRNGVPSPTNASGVQAFGTLLAMKSPSGVKDPNFRNLGEVWSNYFGGSADTKSIEFHGDLIKALDKSGLSKEDRAYRSMKALENAEKFAIWDTLDSILNPERPGSHPRPEDQTIWEKQFIARYAPKKLKESDHDRKKRILEQAAEYLTSHKFDKLSEDLGLEHDSIPVDPDRPYDDIKPLPQHLRPTERPKTLKK